MPKVYLLQDAKYSDITDFTSTIRWSGSKNQAARKLELKMINSILDKNIPNFYIKNGSVLKLFNDDGTLLFKGFVFFNERAGQNSGVTVTAYDHLIYMLKSHGSYNFKNKSAEEITRLLCNDFQVPQGNLAKTDFKQSFIANNKSIYAMIMQAYTGASKKNNKKYLPIIRDGKLDIIEIGNVIQNFMLSDESNILDAGYSESIENMVNRIKIYDNKGNAIGQVENAELIKQYGILQDVYVKEKDKEAYAVAKNLLEGVSKKITIEAKGHIKCLTGSGVHVKDTNTGLTGVFFIDSDTHTWSNGQYIMRLILNFEKVMDERG